MAEKLILLATVAEYNNKVYLKDIIKQLVCKLTIAWVKRQHQQIREAHELDYGGQ